jgi:phosphoenolpyruvate carboxylase
MGGYSDSDLKAGDFTAIWAAGIASLERALKEEFSKREILV